MTAYRVSAPNTDYSGTVGELQFSKGVYEGEVPPAVLAYVKNAGYIVEDLATAKEGEADQAAADAAKAEEDAAAQAAAEKEAADKAAADQAAADAAPASKGAKK